jgi:hypothetical protein
MQKAAQEAAQRRRHEARNKHDGDDSFGIYLNSCERQPHLIPENTKFRTDSTKIKRL